MQTTTNEIKFGTDGWRGVISDTFTFKNVAVVAQAISEWINRNVRIKSGQHKRVAIGFDTRFLSEEYAKIVACVLVKNNIEVFLSDTTIPTPALSYGTAQLKAVAGVMITASHNPAKFNGIKIKTDKGGGASTDITSRVEQYLFKTEVQQMDFDQAVKEGKIVIYDFKIGYLDFFKSYIDLKKIKPARCKVLTDVMHGSGDRLMETILKGTKVNLTLMRDDVNPTFDGGKPEPVVEYLSGILSRMKKEKFDLGLVLDG
ncbi:MAG TPA: phosphoglucomutase/phosphomannomutase family protein, partial [Candidatus Omnitrophota bacterium]|nr:phosphoglucomutase/phosphomannomutase family protein [Candidatus Omnitrophota bacterium]